MSLPFSLRILRSKKRLSNSISLIKNIKNPLFLGLVFFPILKYQGKYSAQDLQIIRWLISECNLSIGKKLMVHLLQRKAAIIQVDGTLFCVTCFEDLYHASLGYEPETLAFIENNQERDCVFVDVGSNIGGYSVRLSRKNRVYAFEPHPKNYSLLTKNLKLNNRNEYYTYNCAVSNKTGDNVCLFTSSFTGCHSIVINSKGGQIKVKTVKIDDALSNEKTVGVIKIDAEGAEPYVLQGAKKTLMRTNFVIFEGSIPNVKLFAHEFLVDLGFKCEGKLDFENYLYTSPRMQKE